MYMTNYVRKSQKEAFKIISLYTYPAHYRALENDYICFFLVSPQYVAVIRSSLQNPAVLAGTSAIGALDYCIELRKAAEKITGVAVKKACAQKM